MVNIELMEMATETQASFHSKVRHLVARCDILSMQEKPKFQSSWITKKKKSPGLLRCFFLRSAESKEQCAVEIISGDTDEDLSSDSCSNTEDIQPEGAATEFVV